MKDEHWFMVGVLMFFLAIGSVFPGTMYFTTEIKLLNAKPDYEYIRASLRLLAMENGFGCDNPDFNSSDPNQTYGIRMVCFNNGSLGIHPENKNITIQYQTSGAYLIFQIPFIRPPKEYRAFKEKLLDFVSQYNNQYEIKISEKQS